MARLRRRNGPICFGASLFFTTTDAPWHPAAPYPKQRGNATSVKTFEFKQTRVGSSCPPRGVINCVRSPAVCLSRNGYVLKTRR